MKHMGWWIFGLIVLFFVGVHAIFGMIVPTLVSAKSGLAVILGIVLVPGYIATVLWYLYHMIALYINSNKEKETT